MVLSTQTGRAVGPRGGQTAPAKAKVDAVIGYANYARFSPGQRICNPSVASRMGLWCKDGSGTVIINGTRHAVHPGDYFFLPWKHHVEYVADARKPFWLAGIHVIPWHNRNRAVEYCIPRAISLIRIGGT